MMSWPKHKWGWIVVSSDKPLASNGIGLFVMSGFAEIFLSRKVADWVARRERRMFERLARHAPISTRGWTSGKNTTTRDEWLEMAKAVKVIRMALPGTYPQFQIPDSLERQLRRSLAKAKPKGGELT
jgi:hypothetical protein